MIKLDMDSHEGRMVFVGNTFQRDMAPQLYQPIVRRTDYGEPERELMFAVLEDAITASKIMLRRTTVFERDYFSRLKTG